MAIRRIGGMILLTPVVVFASWILSTCCVTIRRDTVDAFVVITTAGTTANTHHHHHHHRYHPSQQQQQQQQQQLQTLNMVSIGLGPQDEKTMDTKDDDDDRPKIAGIDYIVPNHEEHRLDRRSKIDIQCDEWFTALVFGTSSTNADSSVDGGIDSNSTDNNNNNNNTYGTYDTGVCTGPITAAIHSQLFTVPPLINDLEHPDQTSDEWTPYVTTKLPWSILYPSYGLETFGLPIPRRNAEAWRNFDITGMMELPIDGTIRPTATIPMTPNTTDTTETDTTETERIRIELQQLGCWLSDEECEGRLIYINGIFHADLSKQQITTSGSSSSSCSSSSTVVVQNIDSPTTLLNTFSDETMQFVQRLTDGFTDALACPVPMQQNADSLLSYSQLSCPHHNVGLPTTQFAINTQQGTAAFAALNTLKCPNMAYIHSNTNVVFDDDGTATAAAVDPIIIASEKLPILIVHAVTEDGGVPLPSSSSTDDKPMGVAMHPRTVVIAEPHTDLNIVQQSVTLFTSSQLTNSHNNNRPTLKNGYTQILIKDYANVTHTMIEESGGVAISGIEDTDNTAIREQESLRPALRNTILDTLDVHCAGTESSYTATTMSANGSGRSRLALYVSLLKPTAHCTLRGLSLTNGLCRSDFRTCIHHIADGTASTQLQKQMVGGRGTSAFRGRIRVEQSAQQTNSQQLSRTVLLSDKCKAVAIPSLEIIADDVKCTHGATVSDLSEEEVFYLRSRGLDMVQARNLLMYAFCNDMVQDIPDSIWLGSSNNNNNDNDDNDNVVGTTTTTTSTTQQRKNRGLQQRIHERLESMTPRGVRAVKGEYQSV